MNTASQIISAVVAGAIAIAALSLIVAPRSKFGESVSALGTSFANVLKEAKAIPYGLQ